MSEPTPEDLKRNAESDLAAAYKDIDRACHNMLASSWTEEARVIVGYARNARVALPAWISRAVAAERETARLRAVNAELREAAEDMIRFVNDLLTDTSELGVANKLRAALARATEEPAKQPHKRGRQ